MVVIATVAAVAAIITGAYGLYTWSTDNFAGSTVGQVCYPPDGSPNSAWSVEDSGLDWASTAISLGEVADGCGSAYSSAWADAVWGEETANDVRVTGWALASRCSDPERKQENKTAWWARAKADDFEVISPVTASGGALGPANGPLVMSRTVVIDSLVMSAPTGLGQRDSANADFQVIFVYDGAPDTAFQATVRWTHDGVTVSGDLSLSDFSHVGFDPGEGMVVKLFDFTHQDTVTFASEIPESIEVHAEVSGSSTAEQESAPIVTQGAQSTFVDGTMMGLNCWTLIPCWPGIRGTQNGLPSAIDDNFNAPTGDSITVTLDSELGPGGMGINWRHGFSKSSSNGMRIIHLNPDFRALYDVPRVVYRLFDPVTRTWSPIDSSELDADDVEVLQGQLTVIGSEFRMDWPPRDKYYVNAGGPDLGPNVDADLPGAPAWTLNGSTKYSQVPFLPRGTRIQYYFKLVDINGGISYLFSTGSSAYEVEDLPPLPGSGILAPDIFAFDVLPRVYPPGTSGTLLDGRSNTPILIVDGAYSAWSHGLDPVVQALRALGIRADRYRVLQEQSAGGGIGGHELIGQTPRRPGNFFPNAEEYGIVDSLAKWYRIMILSAHQRTYPVFDEQDALVIRNWMFTETGTDGGDRCAFVSGDDVFNSLINTSRMFPSSAYQVALANDVFGVAACLAAWSGSGTTPYPNMTDTFTGISYPLDGNSPGSGPFDELTHVGSVGAWGVVAYPVGTIDSAGVGRYAEWDYFVDNDRSKSLGLGFSIQAIRTAGIPPTASNYVHSGVENRMKVLYRFLTSCRGLRTGQTAQCWPCPANFADMQANWAAAAGFNTVTYGPLYPIQDPSHATGVPEEGSGAPRYVNALSQNRPNPFNPETVIPYSLSADGRVTIRVFDVAGRLVRTLVDKRETAGSHIARWDGKAEHDGPLASGIYFYTIRYPDWTTSARKMTILR